MFTPLLRLTREPRCQAQQWFMTRETTVRVTVGVTCASQPLSSQSTSSGLS